MKTETVIVDLDGTIANCDHRLHHIQIKPKNWKAFNAGYCLDTLIQPVFDVIKSIQHQYNIVILTGREGSTQGIKDTKEWLNRHDIYHVDDAPWDGAEIYYDHFLMRKSGDYRPDYEMKLSALDDLIELGYNPTIAFDDRTNVINSFRERGLYVFDCAQLPKE